jgi:hypothetical protein
MSNCASYQDFLGEAITESYRTGKLTKPNTNNKLHKSRISFRDKMQKEAEQQGRKVSDVALDYVAENSGQIQKYILSKGEIPTDENAENLAMQAFNLRKSEVEDIARALGSDLSTAEAYLDSAENSAMEINSPEADSFIGELFDAIAHAASPALQKAVDKRTAKGKKPGVAGFFNNVFSSNDVQTGLVNAGDGVLNDVGTGKAGDIAKGILDQITADQKRKEINKMLPAIIIGVVILIVLVVILTKSLSKK